MQGAIDAITGFFTSAIAIAATYPADTISRRQQVTTVSAVDLKRGSLYKGLGPALGTQPMFWAINMPLYNVLKRQNAGMVSDMLAGFTAGAVATVATNPLWMLRQRMQTETVKGKNNGYSALMRELYAEDGARTFFRGTGITLVKNVQMAFLLPLFERINDLDVWKPFPTPVSAAISGALGTRFYRSIQSTPT